MKKQIRFNDNRKYEWWIISQSYFQSALIGARILHKKLNEFGSDEDLFFKEIYGNYQQSCEYLIFPILFNFKHGIEIYLKSIIGISNSKFPRNHNLIDLLNRAEIKNQKIEIIIKKYAFCQLFLSGNEECDIKNQFERYPQGSPYDKVEFSVAKNSDKKEVTIPEKDNLESFIKWINENNIEINSIINQEKIVELIKDVEFIYKNFRAISIKQDKSKRK